VPLDLDPALIDDARRRDADLDRLIAAVWPEAFRIALSILRDPGLAEDVAQDACANIARSLETLKDTRLFATWSYRIIVNRATTRPHTTPLARISAERSRGVIANDEFRV
jgi:DNA-directed RNA polymerase specialized sigma24 family protein